MASKLAIVAVQNNQLDTLRALAEDTFIATFADANTPKNLAAYTSKTFTLKQVSSEFHTQNSHFFFVYLGGEIAGYLKLNTSLAQTEQGLENAMEIERIYAKRAFQGRGVGKALMQKSITAAQKRNKDWLWLGVWEKNVHAIEFYKRQGYQVFGQHGFFMGDELQHDILMKFPITSASTV
ncbi:MAG: GNAT family N-acetyltransferase [Robiginitomaculum sp.]|nr:MAG: GNAT family N-acetyltransferase [Robiginitomaculum sp.]